MKPARIVSKQERTRRRFADLRRAVYRELAANVVPWPPVAQQEVQPMRAGASIIFRRPPAYTIPG